MRWTAEMVSLAPRASRLHERIEEKALERLDATHRLGEPSIAQSKLNFDARTLSFGSRRRQAGTIGR